MLSLGTIRTRPHPKAPGTDIKQYSYTREKEIRRAVQQKGMDKSGQCKADQEMSDLHDTSIAKLKTMNGTGVELGEKRALPLDPKAEALATRLAAKKAKKEAAEAAAALAEPDPEADAKQEALSCIAACRKAHVAWDATTNNIKAVMIRAEGNRT